MAVWGAQHEGVQLTGHVDVIDVAPLPGEKPLIFKPTQRAPNLPCVHSRRPRLEALADAGDKLARNHLQALKREGLRHTCPFGAHDQVVNAQSSCSDE